MNFKVFVIFLCFITEYSTAKQLLPKTFSLCHRNDPNFNECLKNAIQGALTILRNGIPALKVPSIEPMKIKSVIVDTNGATNTFNLQSSFRDSEIHGLSTSTVLRTASKFNNKKVILKAECYTERMDFAGQYKMKGQILILPVTGQGFGNVSFHQLTTRHEMTCEIAKGNDNENYLKVLNYKIKFIPKRVTYRFDNLFGGDATLGSTLTNFMNENWQPVFEGIIPGYELRFGEKFRDVANILFSQVPFDAIFLE